MSGFDLMHATLVDQQRIIDITVNHAHDHTVSLVENMQRWLDIEMQAKSVAKKNPTIIIRSNYNTLTIKNSSMKFTKQFLKMLNCAYVNSLQVIESNTAALK